MNSTTLTLNGSDSHSVCIPIAGGEKSGATWSFSANASVKYRVRWEADAAADDGGATLAATDIAAGASPPRTAPSSAGLASSEWSEAASGEYATDPIPAGVAGQWIIDFKGSEWSITSMVPAMLRKVPVVSVTVETQRAAFAASVEARSIHVANDICVLLRALASEARRPKWDHAAFHTALLAAQRGAARLRAEAERDEVLLAALAPPASADESSDDDDDAAAATAPPPTIEDVDALIAWLTGGAMKKGWSHSKILKNAASNAVGFGCLAWWTECDAPLLPSEPAGAAAAAAAAAASTTTPTKTKKKVKRRISSASKAAGKSDAAAARIGAKGYSLYAQQLKAQSEGTLELEAVGDFLISAVSERDGTECDVCVNRSMSPRAFAEAVSKAVGFAALEIVGLNRGRAAVLNAKHLATGDCVVASSTKRDGALLSGRIVEILDKLAQGQRTSQVVLNGKIHVYECYGLRAAARSSSVTTDVATAGEEASPSRVAFLFMFRPGSEGAPGREENDAAIRDVALALSKKEGGGLHRHRYAAVLSIEWSGDAGASALPKLIRRVLDAEDIQHAAIVASAADEAAAWAAVAAQRTLRTVIPWIALLETGAATSASSFFTETKASAELVVAHPKLKRVVSKRADTADDMASSLHTLASALSASRAQPWSLCLSCGGATAAETGTETETGAPAMLDAATAQQHSTVRVASVDDAPRAIVEWCFDPARPAPPQTPPQPRWSAAGLDWSVGSSSTDGGVGADDDASSSSTRHWVEFCEIRAGTLGEAQPPVPTELPEMLPSEGEAAAPAVLTAERLLSIGKTTARVGVAAYSGGVGLVVLESVFRGAAVAKRRWREYQQEGEAEEDGDSGGAEAMPAPSRYIRLDALESTRCMLSHLAARRAQLRPGAWYAVKVSAENETARSDDSPMRIFQCPTQPSKVELPTVEVAEVAGTGGAATSYSASLVWMASDGTDTAHYEVQYGNKRIGGWYGKPPIVPFTAVEETSTIVIGGLERPANYSARVRAVGAGGCGEWSDTIYW